MSLSTVPPSALVCRPSVRSGFNRAASSYDQFSIVQKEIAHRLMERVDYFSLNPNMILDAGCGTGYGIKLLKKKFSGSYIIGLDLAEKMLGQAKKIHSNKWGLSWKPKKNIWLNADIESLPLNKQTIDFAWSNLCLQWLNVPDHGYQEIHRVLATNGLFLFSTLGPDTFKELRTVFEGLDQASHVLSFIDMHDLGDALVRQGFSDPVMEMEHITVMYPDVRTLMRDIRSVGANNHTQNRPRGLWGKNQFYKVCERYERFRTKEGIPLTYEVVYGHAWKPEPKKNNQTISPIHWMGSSSR
jgi:malonyl-CoA O-methyltransferase